MNVKITAPKGTKDILPEESCKFQYVEDVLRKLSKNFNFHELRTPTFEHTELFLRGVGDTTDVVTKEMYTFTDKGNRSITLRPEGTAGIARSFIENGLYSATLPQKLYYIISCFRYEKPQAGRLREFHQYGVEMIGTTTPSADAEAIMLANRIFEEFGLSEHITLNLNNIGCKKCRSEYNQKLKDYLFERKDKLCDTCRERMEKNPMRTFDCKSPICKEALADAPTIFDCVCEDCRAHFDKVTTILDKVGIKYEIDKSIVRGLDYYSKTVFEFVSDQIGAQGTVLGGGRYDGLIKDIGGNDEAGIGFAMGLERLLLLLSKKEEFNVTPSKPEIMLIPVDDMARFEAYKLLNELRKANIPSEIDVNERSVKAQMKYANKLGARFTAVLGEDEIKNNTLKLKNMENGEITEVSFSDLIKFMEEKYNG